MMTIDDAIEIIKTVRALIGWDDYKVAFDMAIEALKAQSDKDNNVRSKTDGDCISRKWCLAEYDRQHVGPPGGARKIIAEAPSIVPQCKLGHWIYGEHDVAMTDGYHCDQCGFFVPWDYQHKFIDFIKDYHYCPSCGNPMEEGEP